MIGFIAIFAAALCGYAGVGLWAPAASAVALASLSFAENGGLYRRGKELGLTEITTSTLLLSFGHAMAASGGAYVVGAIFRLN
ncbi:MAG: hypothetical protein B7Y80_01940 [Hyphomicrobium sp. 32-62-53]|nr:MAG: hypothetical protein B7Z29_02290 [Hyphomicrobium sp. 12-62-95]OYY01509.1 MAG: hypothetical protein B7Y80_01940 [Hyphomicrobium sp. 32-62-53]